MLRKMMMKRTVLSLLGLGLFVGVAGAQQRSVELRRTSAEEFGPASDAGTPIQAPAPWIQEDPGSQAYTAAREALNARRYREAANAFASLRRDHPRSAYVADSYYYQAFALSRLGNRSDYREARELLRTQRENHGEATTLGDAEELLIRVESRLAQQGDAQAARTITQQAQDPCGPEQEVRAAALNALLNMNADRALPILKQVLEERDACSAELRQQAVFLISQKLDDESVDILLDLAHRNPDPDPEVREQAVFWLSQVESAEALDALESILMESQDPELQENALFAISQHSSQRSGEILREYARRTDLPVEVRETALFWIGQSPGGADYLKSIWNTLDEPELKDNILHGIAQQDDAESRNWLMARARDSSEDMEIRTNALFWVGQMERGFTIQELRELFTTFSDPEMKEQLIFAASQREEPEAVDFLMEVARDPENGEMREQAIFWLGQSDDPRVPEFLLGIIGR